MTENARPGDASASAFFSAAVARPSLLWIGEWGALVLGGTGGTLTAISASERVKDVAAISGTVISIIVGAALAAMSVQAAVAGDELLGRLKSPQYVLQLFLPFLTTTLVGLLAVSGMVAWTALDPTSAPIARVVTGAFAGAMGAWTVASLIPALGTVVQLLEIRAELAAKPGDPKA